MNVPFMPSEEIADAAYAFLRENDAIDSIPIPIEEIVEGMGIDIIPIPGLQRLLSIDGFMSCDFSEISVDQEIYNNIPVRYRFTLAHEVGHKVLHSYIYEKLSFSGIDGWKKAICEFDQGAYDRIEYQGYAFGGFLLVPSHLLKLKFDETLPSVMPLIDTAKRSGLDRKKYLAYAEAKIASQLAKDFDVSTEVIERCIRRDELSEAIP